MAISLELEAFSPAPVTHVFRTIADLRSWDTFAGVVLTGPDRAVLAGDRIDVGLKVMRRELLLGCEVRSVEEPTEARDGAVDIRSVEGPFDARMIGVAGPAPEGCRVRVEVYGIGRGAARMLERPVDLIMRQWATHQMRHLLALAARAPQPA